MQKLHRSMDYNVIIDKYSKAKGQFHEVDISLLLCGNCYCNVKWSSGVIVYIKITSEPSIIDEEQRYRKNRRRRRSAALSTPPAVHVHIGSDGPTSNGSISSRGIYHSSAMKQIGLWYCVTETGVKLYSWDANFRFFGVSFQKCQLVVLNRVSQSSTPDNDVLYDCVVCTHPCHPLRLCVWLIFM